MAGAGVPQRLRVAWMRFAARHTPDAVPPLLAHDPDGGLFAMAFLAAPPVWKPGCCRAA